MIVNLDTTDLGLLLKNPLVAFERASYTKAVLSLDPARTPPPASLRGA